MFTVYVLYSCQYKKTYVGFTSDLEQWFRSHNELGIKGWTVKFRPWKIVHTEVYQNKQEAMRREKFFKSGQGRQQVQRLVQEWLEKY